MTMNIFSILFIRSISPVNPPPFCSTVDSSSLLDDYPNSQGRSHGIFSIPIPKVDTKYAQVFGLYSPLIPM